MRILVLGGDGYLGWPTAMRLALRGHDVCVMDNYAKRKIARETGSEALVSNLDLNDRAALFFALTGKQIRVIEGDCADAGKMAIVFSEFQPETAIHYAEQPSAPYSMRGFEEASFTLNNNLNTTLSLIWAVMKYVPTCHIIKLGTMGEYGTPNIDIEEGWIDIKHNGREDRFLYPRQGGSLYHTTKVMDTDMLWFYVRTYGLRVTDLMQGPVYGLLTAETRMDDRLLPNFHYDDIFGTVVNRFLVQAVAGMPLTVYGKGGQTRGFINLEDTLQCVELAADNPPLPGELRIYNQFTEKFTVLQLAERISKVGNAIGLPVEIGSIENPRKEMEKHYYNAKHHGLLELGLQPHLMTDDVLAEIMEKILLYKSLIDSQKIKPRVCWG